MIPLAERQNLLLLIDQARAAGARLRPVCDLIGISARTFQRWTRDGQVRDDARLTRQFTPANKLSDAQREQLLVIANSPEFTQLPPSQFVPILADRGEYVASESTFYRVLRAAKQLKHRQASRPAKVRAKPAPLQANAPNQVYTWDITYLPTPILGMYFYLYLFMDIFSRKIVGWQVYAQENADRASQIIQDIAFKEGIAPDQVTLHADNGGPMKGSTMVATLQKLGIFTSFSRPAVSNDNPYSEALFRTLKYRPEYPSMPFADIAQARQWVADFVHWYNLEHRHSAIGFVTPAQRHEGLDQAILAHRHVVYEAAKAKHPERWSKNTRSWNYTEVVYLNPDKQSSKHSEVTMNTAA